MKVLKNDGDVRRGQLLGDEKEVSKMQLSNMKLIHSVHQIPDQKVTRWLALRAWNQKCLGVNFRENTNLTA